MRRAHFAVALFALLSAVHARPAGAESTPESRDPRMERASALLGDESGYPEAVSLYRAVLADDPAANEARLWLARVLAWQQQYDASLAEFERLLDAEPSAELRVETGEVLSWAGRTAEAEAVLQSVLSADPNDARATRALARVYRWSDRRVQADGAYARALELEEDAEARAEWIALRADTRPSVAGAGNWFADSDDFERGRFGTRGEVHLDFRTALRAEIAYLHAEGRGVDPLTGARPLSNVEGGEASVVLERELESRWRARLGFGRRQWHGARDHWRVHGELEFSPNERTSVSVSGRFGDALEATDSYRVITSGVRIGEATVSLWKELGHGLELYGAFSSGWLSAGNSRYSGSAGLSLAPLQGHDLRIELSGSGLGYTERSPLYYDPGLDIEGTLTANYRQALPLDMKLDLTLSGGVGTTRESGVAATGPAVRAGASLSRKTDAWEISLAGAYARSQRGASYESTLVRFAVARSF